MPRALKNRLQIVATDSASASKFETIFDQSSDAIVSFRADGSIDAANYAFEALTGYLKEELMSAKSSLLAPSIELQKISPKTRPWSTEVLKTSGTYEDVLIGRKDGYSVLVELSIRHVRSDDGDLAISIFRDVSEKKRMERDLITKHTELRNAYLELERKNADMISMQEMLVQAGKMAALGELAAGIAHELNQPLQAIRGYAQELQVPEVQSNHSVRDAALREVIFGADKMAKIIDQMREFTRKSTKDYGETQVHQVIDEALKMFDRQFKSRGIEVAREYPSEPDTVYANPFQLEQVFINLVSNARDAIEATQRGRGLITIRTLVSNSFVEVIFKDDGSGMAEKTKAKAFNPFFTTKEVGQGMGMGLSLSYGILSKLQASIVVESELGKGSEFRICIPRDFRELG